MSYDRVLPKPVPLHHDSSQASASRPTSNLLEHKIMNDDSNMADHRMDNAPTYRYNESLPKVDLLSLHRARVGVNNKTPSSPSGPSLEAPRPSKSLPMRDRSSLSERSSSASPVASTAPGPRDSVTQFCLCQPDRKIPRPRNAFILYRQANQGAVGNQNPGLANPDISKIIGEQWRKLPQATKDDWKALAEEEKIRHQQQYPEYRYKPRRFNREGSSGSLGSGLSHNPPGATTCTRCGGRIMNPPASPDTVYTGGSVSSGRPSQADITASRSYSADQPRPMKHGSRGQIERQIEHRPSRARQWEDSGSQSPDTKRRRTNPHVPFRPELRHEKSPPRSPYGVPPPYTGRTDSVSARAMSHSMQPPRGLRPVKEHPQPDPSLKLPPLQTAASVAGSAATPITPFPQEGLSVEAAVMNIPFLNKIRLLAKIAPQLPLSFHDPDVRRRGPVIAVDGQDPALVKSVADYLHRTLQKEGKFHPRTFDGPEILQQKREGSTEPDDMNEKQANIKHAYFNHISKWHTISDDIINFVKSEPPRHSAEPDSGSGTEKDGSPKVSPRTMISKAAGVNMNSPPASSETGSEAASASASASAASPPETETTIPSTSLPVAIVPQYQLTTADAYACIWPIVDSYNVPDHWQWMASLWRSAVGPDITVYVRDCDVQELKQVGNPVEIRLQDFKTIVVRRPTNSPRELEEKVLKRLGFEIEDHITQ